MKQNNNLEDVMFRLMSRSEDPAKQRHIDYIGVLRVIQYFPKKGNQRRRKIIAYDGQGQIIECWEATYVDIATLRRRIDVTVIEDDFYMQRKKDFDFYTVRDLS